MRFKSPTPNLAITPSSPKKRAVRFLTPQHPEDNESMSDSDMLTISGNCVAPIIEIDCQNPFESNQVRVRTISQTCNISVEKVCFNISLAQLPSNLGLFQRKFRTPTSKPELSTLQLESESLTTSVCQPLALHSGVSTRRCGDCRSSILTSKILAR
jgi:hypothetical protein